MEQILVSTKVFTLPALKIKNFEDHLFITGLFGRKLTNKDRVIAIHTTHILKGENTWEWHKSVIYEPYNEKRFQELKKSFETQKKKV